jgi:hypothetical protein
LQDLRADLDELSRGFEGQDPSDHQLEPLDASAAAKTPGAREEHQEPEPREPGSSTSSKSREKFMKILSDQVKFLTPVAFPDRGDFELTVRGGGGPAARPDRVMCKGLWTSALADMCRLDTQLAEFLWRSMFPKIWAVLKDDQKVSSSIHQTVHY